MCDACVIESVKKKMLSRRDLFKTVAAGATATALTSAAVSAPVMASGASKIEDMTHELHEDFPTYFGAQQFFREQKFNYAEHKFNLLELRVNEHMGTHMDAPLHFSENGQSVAEIPVENLVVPLCVIDIKEKAAGNANAQVTPEEIKAWISSNGPIPNRACIAMNSGWDKYASSEKFRNVGSDEKMHFPGFHVETAQMLLETNAVGLASDSLSLDFGQSGDFATHYAWLPTNRWGIECLANLDNVPAKGATLIVGAPKHRGGTGGQSRILALF